MPHQQLDSNLRKPAIQLALLSFVWLASVVQAQEPNILIVHKNITDTADNINVRDIAFLPAGKLVGVYADNMIRVWNVETGQVERKIDSQLPLGRLAVHPQGKWIAVSVGDEGKQRRIGLWNLETGKLERTLEGHTGDLWISALVFSPDGNFIASDAADDDRVLLWNIETGQPKEILRDSKYKPGSLVFSPNGKLLACVYGHGIRFDALDGSEPPKLDKLNATVDGITFSADGRYFAAGGILWPKQPAPQLKVNDQNMVLNFDEIASQPFAGMIYIWDMATWKLQDTLTLDPEERLRITSPAISPDGQTLASGTVGKLKPEGNILLWDIKTDKLRKRLRNISRVEDGSCEAGGSPIFSPDGKFLAVPCGEFINVWPMKRVFSR